MTVEKVYEINTGLRCAVCEQLFLTPEIGRMILDSCERAHECCWDDPGECVHSQSWPS